MTTPSFRSMAAAMDLRVRQLEAQGHRGPQLVYHMVGHLRDLQTIYDQASDEQLFALAREYPNFHRFARLMEDTSEAQRAQPASAYGGMPPLPKDLQEPVMALTATAATLERSLQTVVDTGHPERLGGQLAALRATHTQWQQDWETVIGGLKTAGVPEPTIAFIEQKVLMPMAERIARLMVRIGGLLPPSEVGGSQTDAANSFPSLAQLSDFAAALDGEIRAAQDLLNSLRPARDRPGQLDDATIERTKQCLAGSYRRFRACWWPATTMTGWTPTAQACGLRAGAASSSTWAPRATSMSAPGTSIGARAWTCWSGFVSAW
ncbi:MAG: hypothetical protein P4L83_24215 [Nevskia sp.]|nr:hypothetical protein [Nevskia sp.]